MLQVGTVCAAGERQSFNGFCEDKPCACTDAVAQCARHPECQAPHNRMLAVRNQAATVGAQAATAGVQAATVGVQAATVGVQAATVWNAVTCAQAPRGSRKPKHVCAPLARGSEVRVACA